MSFPLSIITPSSTVRLEVDSARAEDSTGSFGIMARHQDFLTLLRPCIIICKAGESEKFAAVDGGILRVEGGVVTVASREAVEGDNFKDLKDMISAQFCRKEEKAAAFMELLNNMEKLLVDNLIKFEKGSS